MKCPACGMETPEEPGYCDFCKEPFRRKPPPPEPKAPQKVVLPPEVMAKLLEAKRDPPPSPAGEGPDLPKEFVQLAAAERMPVVPAWARYSAWAFLAGILALSAVGFVYVMTRPRPKPPARAQAPLAQPSPPVAPPADLPPGVPDEEPLAPPPPPPPPF